MDRWLEIAAAACDHAGLEVGSIETLVTWDQEHRQNAAYRLDAQRILKVYGPTAEQLFHTEFAALRTLEHNQAIPVPRIVAAGEPSQRHPYLVLTAIPGSETVDFWKGMTSSEQLAVAEEVGKLFAAVHRLPQEELEALELKFPVRSGNAIKREEARRTAEIIEATEVLSLWQRDDLLRFLHEEAPEYLNGPPKFTHADLSHHHVYLARETGTWRVSGIIDWAEAALGPPEWDIACLWHWTFNGVWHATFTGEWEAMKVCLRTFFAGHQPPKRFARRCLAAFLHSPWVDLLWSNFLKREGSSKDIVRDLTEYMFTPDVFGPPD
ncbi:phosphotransferase family protein [Chloroflexota bacterium]